MDGADDARSWDSDQAITVLYTAHYRRLVSLAGLLTHDRAAAEEIVQDAFVGLHRNWQGLRDADRAAAYLRQSTVNGVRSAGRRSVVVVRHEPLLRQVTDSPDPAEAVADRSAVMGALARLPERQREVLVLRYYGDLSEADIAEALGISRGAVKTHASRGLAALRPTLEQVR